VRDTGVLIIGGGPAGSTCAWRLRRAGSDVVVFDRRPFPRDKVCAGWITPQVVAELGLDLEEYAAGGRTLQLIRGFRVGVVGQSEVAVAYDRVVSYGIRRCEFDDYLLRRSGAEAVLGEPLRSLERERDAWVVNGDLRARVLVGAGGHFCPVAQRLGAHLGQGEPIVAAQEAEIPLAPGESDDCRVEPELPEIFFTPDLKGYGWVLRKGGYVNIGLGRQDSHRLGDHVDDFLAFLRARGKISSALAARMKGHPYLLYGQAPRPLVADGALLVGDAAGLAYPRSGEGIRPAIESGILAAEVISAAGGAADAASLRPYERRIVERFGPRDPGRGILDLLPEWMLQAAASLLLRSRAFSRRVVMDRWFFHLDQAPLS
jgi:geranylgeranyl reductase family protein